MPGRFAERNLPPHALTDKEHAELMKTRRRPITQEPIQRKTVEDKAAPDLSDDWYGVMPARAVPDRVREAS